MCISLCEKREITVIANEQSIESCTVAYLVVFRDLNTVHPGVYVQLGERQTPCLGRLEGAEGALAVVPQPGEGVQAAASILPLHLQQPLLLQGAGVPHHRSGPDHRKGRGSSGERLVTSCVRDHRDGRQFAFPMAVHHLPGCPRYAGAGDTASEP